MKSKMLNNKIKIEEYSIYDIFRYYQEGKLIIPRLQRSLVWSKEQKESLRDTISKNLPIGTLYFHNEVEQEKENEKDQYYIIDGLQRTTTIIELFINPLADSLEAFKSSIIDSFEEYNIKFNISDNSIKVIYEAMLKFNLSQYIKEIDPRNLDEKQIYNFIYDNEFKNLNIDDFKNENKTYLILGIKEYIKHPIKRAIEYKVPAIIFFSSSRDAALVFERLNSNGKQLTNLEILTASWNHLRVKVNYDYVDNYYKGIFEDYNFSGNVYKTKWIDNLIADKYTDITSNFKSNWDTDIQHEELEKGEYTPFEIITSIINKSLASVNESNDENIFIKTLTKNKNKINTEYDLFLNLFLSVIAKQNKQIEKGNESKIGEKIAKVFNSDKRLIVNLTNAIIFSMNYINHNFLNLLNINRIHDDKGNLLKVKIDSKHSLIAILTNFINHFFSDDLSKIDTLKLKNIDKESATRVIFSDLISPSAWSTGPNNVVMDRVSSDYYFSNLNIKKSKEIYKSSLSSLNIKEESKTQKYDGKVTNKILIALIWDLRHHLERTNKDYKIFRYFNANIASKNKMKIFNNMQNLTLVPKDSNILDISSIKKIDVRKERNNISDVYSKVKQIESEKNNFEIEDTVIIDFNHITDL